MFVLIILLLYSISVTEDSNISKKSPDLLIKFIFTDSWRIIKVFVLSSDKFELQLQPS